MKKQTIGLCGYFDTEHTIVNGQTQRTLAVAEQLEKTLGKARIQRFDYSFWRKNPFRTFFGFLSLLRKCASVVIFPDDRAIHFIVPLAAFAARLWGVRMSYVVIGGWLPGFLPAHPLLRRRLLRFQSIFVQTETLRKALEEQGFPNVYTLPNFRTPPGGVWLTSQNRRNGLLRCCSISRIEEKKGIREMVDAIKTINADTPRCLLDIYGPVQKEYQRVFDQLIAGFPSSIRYRGVLDSRDVNRVLSGYDIQLFPTKYRTEGFPGSVLDSFYAGVPVLASEWDSGKEVIREGIDGCLFPMGRYDQMQKKLLLLADNPSLLDRLKAGSRERGRQYDAAAIIGRMIAVLCRDTGDDA